MAKYARLIGPHRSGFRRIAQLLGLKTLCYNPAFQRAARKPINKMPERQLQPGQESPAANRSVRRRRVRIALLSVATILLFTLLFVQAAFDLLPWIRPSSASEAVTLFALSTINLLAFIVLLMVLVRNIIKLRRERRQMKLGAKFKTRLVSYFISLSLLPVIFLFFATSNLISRSVEKWFSQPADQMVMNARGIEHDYVEGEKEDLKRVAATLARLVANTEPSQVISAIKAERENQQLEIAQLYNRQGELIAEQSERPFDSFDESFRTAWRETLADSQRGAKYNNDSDKPIYLIAAAPVPGERGGRIIIAQQVAPDFAERINKINLLQREYDALKGKQKWVKYTALLTLGLITLLVLFIAFWLAVYVSRSIADPVQQLAQATERIKSGDLSSRANVVGDDELAALALSFNEMTAELAENRRRLERSASDLQMNNAALEERRRYIETVMQSLSAGVVSLDEARNVTMINGAARRLLRIDGEQAAGAALESLLPEEQRDELRKIIQRAAPSRPITHEVHFTMSNQTKLDAAITVTALDDPRGRSRGAVIVIEDLTELIEAQRRAAWSEVARRMAHEIKNPLTPIKLSAERLAKNLLSESNEKNGAAGGLSEREMKLVRECTTMIGAEVSTLQRMVDEFSNFARLPKAALETASLNEVVEKSLRLYDERLNGIQLSPLLAPKLPSVMIDCEQIKRALVNLIDNAAEAMSGMAGDRRITVITREVPERESLELIVADTGPGIPSEDRERIFDPYFSTRKRGTGLGLAIVSRIVAEHQGRIRAQENLPRGARFIIELPTGRRGENE
jgi:PAS domain S-box-containing protein